MPARSMLTNGTVVRWHPYLLEECRDARCSRQHLSLDELHAEFDRDREHWFEQGVAMAKGELP